MWLIWYSFIILGSKITLDGDFSHEIKRCLLLRRKVMTNLDSICKSRDISLPTKVRLVKAMVFPVVMYGCESWTVKKAEPWRIDAFQLCVGDSPTPRVYSNSCSLSRWCHPTISSSVVPFSSCLLSVTASGSFQVSQLFISDDQIIGVSAST